jgi:flagellar protein FlgJ
MKRNWIIAALALFAFAALFGYRKMTRSEFALTIKDALKFASLRDLRPDWLAALAAHETGWGSGNVFQRTRNLFSITKGSSWTGPVYDVPSTGYTFRIYGTYAASVQDFVDLIYRLSRYAPVRNASSVEEFARALQAGGYGDPNDPKYAAKIVDNHNAIKGHFA